MKCHTSSGVRHSSSLSLAFWCSISTSSNNGCTLATISFCFFVVNMYFWLCTFGASRLACFPAHFCVGLDHCVAITRLHSRNVIGSWLDLLITCWECCSFLACARTLKHITFTRSINRKIAPILICNWNQGFQQIEVMSQCILQITAATCLCEESGDEERCLNLFHHMLDSSCHLLCTSSKLSISYCMNKRCSEIYAVIAICTLMVTESQPLNAFPFHQNARYRAYPVNTQKDALGMKKPSGGRAGPISFVQTSIRRGIPFRYCPTCLLGPSSD